MFLVLVDICQHGVWKVIAGVGDGDRLAANQVKSRILAITLVLSSPCASMHHADAIEMHGFSSRSESIHRESRCNRLSMDFAIN